MSKAIGLEQFRETLRKVHIQDRRRGFKAHVISYLSVNAGLIAINLLTGPERLWSLGSVLGWGIGVVVHYLTQIRFAERQLRKMEAETEALIAEP